MLPYDHLKGDFCADLREIEGEGKENWKKKKYGERQCVNVQ